MIRIPNNEVNQNFSGVCEYIDSYVKNSHPQSAALTAPSAEGAED